MPMEEGCGEDCSDVFSQIRQLDYLLSKSRELKLRSRADFEEDFEEIKAWLPDGYSQIFRSY